MPWCPKCRLEYRDGFLKCHDCKVDLVEELENYEKEPIEYDSKEFLTTASDNTNANMIESKLNDDGIPVLKKYRETGGYLSIYMGITNFGIDLYVPSKLLGRAKELIRSEVGIERVHALEKEKSSVDDEALSELNNKYQKNRQIRAWIILLLFIPGFLWILSMHISRLIGLFL